MSLRHAVLGLLAQGPASGYDLRKTFDASLSNVWPATQSQLYGELGKLADAGQVTVAAEGPRGRKEYAITDAGMAELRHWLTEVEPERVRRSDMLLRVFFLGVLDPEDAQGYLRRQVQAVTAQHERFRALADVVDEGDDSLSVYGRIALEWGLRFTETQREWARWAQERIAREATAAKG
ncbi:PadR family transcriptional regulator [Wenjunlia tyrosinilytica]|uniref:PadR family transcriptional regulator n=1 Tax=Wenjunlia tyrosinilytica TaxID=1544741 RepID=A0A917ZS91_9ACTN|nr:PadR family transcriptional regulator [Wenjunlia tyrosinilytica]GGO90717.1 PadR family transcriptional regulator [Wenjunlia tyrosinilytica]